MSVGQNAVMKTYAISKVSQGTVSGTDPVIYTETNANPSQGFGQSFTITGVSTDSMGNTMLTGYITTIANTQVALTGTLVANDTNKFIVLANFNNQTGYLLVTNNAADQPGVGTGKTVSLPGENTANSVAYDPNQPCFVAGTLIRTMRGDVAVENLVVGDIAISATGRRRPVKWLGNRTVDYRAHRNPTNILPVRIAAHAFGANLPERDLRLSPGHPVLVGADEDGAGGHLVPIMCLINGTTIERLEVETVTYWHVELDEHDILLAEGLPAESYLDWGDRPFFDEASNHALHNPDFVVPGLGARCRPVAVDGPVVEAERRRLDAVFNARLREASAWPDADALTGHEAA